MSDNQDNSGVSPQATGDVPGMTIEVRGQYIKDLSFENPLAPRTMQDLKDPLDISVDVNTSARTIEDDAHEVVLAINARATAGEDVVFIVELVYAGLVAVRNVPRESLQPLLFIEAPRLLFPFARNIVGEATRNGGYPPLLLNPIDFAQLYRERMAQGASGTA
ncbi:MAG: protein-export chaperone SecB [Alphaproteobacteria bacterium]